ncbi:hypothetical protein BDA99DRAFT_533340 [Phascolomyces articulosus]|uniref:RRM domain-containing protein n=1 Tax=Phascolomyces articulosus TaxID=60185 RepID=A0AAD5K8T5_9FUNG|nr:hypothetical protein BDA99DRAFT_533340 [Phascolomyces articulosus]
MSSLDKALDDVIKDNRKNNRRGRSDQKPRRQQSNFGSSSGGIRKRTTGPRNNGGGGGPIASKIIRTVQVRGGSGGGGSRFGGRGNVNKQWAHDKFDDRDGGFGGRSSIASRLGGRAGASSGGQGGRQNDNREIKIENLHYNVVEKDLQDLFEMVGRIEKTRIIFDRSGRSTGTAHVKFTRRADAEAAIEKYNNVELDGQAMTIEMAVERRGGGGNSGSGGGRFTASNNRGGGGRRGGNSGGRDRRNNNDGGANKKRSEADLDNEMDAYMNTTTENGGDDNQMVID